MTQQEIEKLKIYNKRTTIAGIIMPTKDEFDNKIKIATKLWPQINKSNTVDYLFGKGVGVELALLGEVQNRNKNNCNFPYRSHSDFEIYDTLGYDKIPESKDFVSVFGAQEIYPKTKTKGLKSIPYGYMDQTFDTIIYQGNIYLVPELELLFLDKYIKQEATPRDEGCDALLLLNKYQLDINKIIDYFQRFVKEPNLQIYDEIMNGIYDKQLLKINQLFQYAIDLLTDDNIPISFENIIITANNYINKYRNCATVVNGIYLPLCPQKLKFIEKNGEIDISDKNKEEIKQLIIQSRINKEQKYDNIINEIKNQ